MRIRFGLDQWKRLGWKLLFVVLLLMIAEGLAWAFLTSPSNSVHDPYLGFVHLPDSLLFDGSEGGAYLRLSSLGLNSPPVLAKDARQRVLVLGDSLTQAIQVPRDRNFCSLLMKERPDLELINAGRPGAGPLECLEVCKRLESVVHPDAVLLVLSTNDLQDIRKARCDLVRDDAGAIKRIDLRPAPEDRLRRVLKPVVARSALATYLMRRVKTFIGQKEATDADGKGAGWSVADADACGEILRHVLTEIAAKHRTYVVFLPGITYRPKREAAVAPNSLEIAGVCRRAVEGAGLQMIMVDRPLIEAYRKEGQPGHGFMNAAPGSGHLNERGHAAVAEFLGNALARERLIR